MIPLSVVDVTMPCHQLEPSLRSSKRDFECYGDFSPPSSGCEANAKVAHVTFLAVEIYKPPLCLIEFRLEV